jgi:hypothetical protein
MKEYKQTEEYEKATDNPMFIPILIVFGVIGYGWFLIFKTIFQWVMA